MLLHLCDIAVDSYEIKALEWMNRHSYDNNVRLTINQRQRIGVFDHNFSMVIDYSYPMYFIQNKKLYSISHSRLLWDEVQRARKILKQWLAMDTKSAFQTFLETEYPDKHSMYLSSRKTSYI